MEPKDITKEMVEKWVADRKRREQEAGGRSNLRKQEHEERVKEEGYRCRRCGRKFPVEKKVAFLNHQKSCKGRPDRDEQDPCERW